MRNSAVGVFIWLFYLIVLFWPDSTAKALGPFIRAIIREMGP